MTFGAPTADEHAEAFSIAEVLSAERHHDPSPPLPTPASLPIGELEPPMVERLVAEVAMRVDGTPHVRVHGRRGQAQGGLDLWGGPVGNRSVYQVRRIDHLTPQALRDAVEDYAGPPHRGTRTPTWTDRRFDARRFVLATGCSVLDTAADLELAALQHEYNGDLEIVLWDNSELSRMLRDRGPLVAGIFGQPWAEAFCGYHPPPGTPTPGGRALLNDPVVFLGLAAVRDGAVALTETDPSGAATRYGELAQLLAEASFTVVANGFRRLQRDLHSAAREIDAAVTVSLQLLLEANDHGTRAQHEVSSFSPLGRLAEDLPGLPIEVSDWTSGDPLNFAAATAARAITLWADQGFTLDPVATALQSLADGAHPLAARLTLAVAEQVIADDDPADDTELLRCVVAGLLPALPSGLLRVRLECALADLEVRTGVSTMRAFREVVTRARTGAITEPGHAALALRRAAYALAATGHTEDAINTYQEAVLQASEAHLGGDSRDALRAIQFLTTDLRVDFQISAAAAATGNRARVLPGAEEAAMSMLEHLADDHKHAALAHAAFEVRTWRRIERSSGALVEELIAYRRHGQVLRRAGEPAAAVIPLIRGRQHELAAEAATNAPWSDVSRFLENGPPWVRRAACAVAGAQADLDDAQAGVLRPAH